MRKEKKINFKILAVLIFQLLALGAFAQSPALINYQGMLRDNKGLPVINQAIALRFEVLQGSDTGPVVYTDDQLSGVSTNSLGLFSTQIGKNSAIGQVNWEQGVSYFLQVSVDPTGGNNLQILGKAQQLLSVPYALHAQSVPASYTNNVLSIGNKTFNITPTITATPNTSITSSGLGTVTSVGTNSFDINIPAANIALTNTAGAAGISTVSPNNFNINVPSPNIAVTNTAGAVSVTTLGINDYVINIPPAGAPLIIPQGVLSQTASGNTFTLDVPASNIALTNTVGAAAVSTISPNNFNINIPPSIVPVITQQGVLSHTASGGNYTLNVPASNIAVTNTLGAVAVSTISPNNFNINIPPSTVPVITQQGVLSHTASGGNYTLNVPASNVAVTNTVGAVAVSTISPNNFNINIPPSTVPVITQQGVLSHTASGGNYTLNVPASNVAVTSTVGAVAVSTISPNNFNINIPPSSVPVITQQGVLSHTASGGNYTLNVPASNIALTTTAGAVGITTVSANNFNINVPSPNIAVSTTAGAVGISTVSANNYNINIPPVANVWSLLGNAGTSTLTNFIGTIDNVELNFRVNGNKSGTIDHILNNAYFGFQSGLSTTSASLNAGFGQEALKSISSANRNSAFGYQALKNSNGGSNTGIGASALTSNTSGADNTALGKDALYLNTTGSFNVGVGSGVFLNHLSGDNNVAIGRDAFNGNTSGANNVAVGSLAGYANVSGSGNVFIGYNAGYNETGSNKFILANTSTTTSPLLYGNFATNNLGIGTTSANAPLQFNQTISGRKIVLWEGVNNDHQVYGFGLSTDILRYQVDAASASHVFYSGINATTSKELMRITGAGNVGIGTSAPATNLHINSSSNFTQVRLTHTASASFGLVMGTDNLSSALLNYDNTPMYFGTNGANRMSVSNTGNVNIGNFIASQKLNVDGNISLDDAAGSTSPARVIGFPVASTGNHGLLTLQAKSQVFSGTAFSGGNLLLAGGDYNVGSVNTSGSFGGNITIQAGHNLWPHATGALILFQAGTTSNTERMRIDGATGMVGIGTTAPDQLLTVNGNASKPGGGSWATFSDRRLKKDIHSFNDGLKELLKIEPVWYTYNGEASLPQDTFVGVIAQDLQSIAPYMVKETSRGIVGEPNYLSVDNSAMTYIIINAIKEQQKLIEVLTQKIEDQKKEIDILKKQ